jgi:hypothetical protein
LPEQNSSSRFYQIGASCVNSHLLRHLNAQRRQRSCQRAPRQIGHDYEQCTPGRIFFRDDLVVVVEKIESLCEIESLFREDRRLILFRRLSGSVR